MSTESNVQSLHPILKHKTAAQRKDFEQFKSFRAKMYHSPSDALGISPCSAKLLSHKEKLFFSRPKQKSNNLKSTLAAMRDTQENGDAW